MTVTTWVLVIMVKVGYAGGMATVPGYSSYDDCTAAAAAFVEEVGSSWTRSNEAFCIPGPVR